jgi:hypothetical protein
VFQELWTTACVLHTLSVMKCKCRQMFRVSRCVLYFVLCCILHKTWPIRRNLLEIFLPKISSRLCGVTCHIWFTPHYFITFSHLECKRTAAEDSGNKKTGKEPFVTEHEFPQQLGTLNALSCMLLASRQLSG